MFVKIKISEKQDELGNFILYCNKIIKYIMVQVPEEVIKSYLDDNNFVGLFKEYQKNLGLTDAFGLTDTEWMFFKELTNVIKNDDWNPRAPIDIKEYLEIRMNLVIPVLQEGTLEYKLLEKAYADINQEALAEFALTYSGVFIYKTLDFKTIETE